ncbi:putative transporter [Calothrix sp. NIES-4071]|nr:putative transporter [Calothrix sp. NIES-4071]BAZ63116.1 putative transporter [Calothrix sp. NIES-4105]
MLRALFAKKSNISILRWISLSILVLALIIEPGVFSNSLFFTGAQPQEMRAVAQTPSQTAPQNNNQPQQDKQDKSDTKKDSEGKLNVFKMTMGAIAGLVLFLYGVTRMAEGLEAIAGNRAKNWIKKFTTNRYAGVATGAVATTLLDSSSVTIIIVIAMVSAGLLTFVESLGVVLGSNIGTTLGAQLIAFKINQYAPIALLIAFLLLMFGKTDRLKQIGLVILGFGLLFFGLDQIENAMEPLENHQPFLNLMERLGNNTVLGALVGALFTVLVQSSSATVAIVVTLASQGLVSLPAGVALVLGAEVGTCADTLVATIGRERPALRTGIFHLLFNLTTASIGVLLAAQLAKLASVGFFIRRCPR